MRSIARCLAVTEDGQLEALIALPTAAITALVTWLIAQRRVAMENATGGGCRVVERVRAQTLQVHWRQVSS